MAYKKAVRTVTARRDTRAALLHAAVPLFRDRGIEHVSLAEIARATDAYPNQVTYHFHSKEGLFVHAACHAILRTAHQAEQLTRNSDTPGEHARDLVTYLLGPGAPEVMMFAEAMLTARRTPELQQLITDTTTELYAAGEAAMSTPSPAPTGTTTPPRATSPADSGPRSSASPWRKQPSVNNSTPPPPMPSS